MPRPALALLVLFFAVALNACAILVVPALATGQELSRDRKSEFETRRNAMVGAEVRAWCDAPKREGELIHCGKLVRTTNTETTREYTFEIVPPGCSYAITVGTDERITAWRYASEPSECWKFFLAPP